MPNEKKSCGNFPPIITKTGDKGLTSLWSGERVSKGSDIIIAIGKVSSLSSFLGLLKDKDTYRRGKISGIQKDLISLMGIMANTNGEALCEEFEKEEMVFLESMAQSSHEQLSLSGYKIEGWITYGDEGGVSAAFDYATNLCREAECWAVRGECEPVVIKYLNRLSDYLYLSGRLYADLSKLNEN